MNNFAAASGRNFSPDPSEDVMESIFKQYERVLIESIVSSFGLEFIMHDRHGGDVDTIRSVRQVGKDKKMTYKNKENLASYENRSEYDSIPYHKNKEYKEKNREISRQKDAGTLKDAYTGEKIARNEKSDLDHVISAKEIHDDPGRVLSGLKGTDLANNDENLQATNPHTNRSKKADSMDEYLEKRGGKYTEEQKTNMRKKDKESRKLYESRIATTYYTSSEFAKDVAVAASSVSLKMGMKQVLGFVFAEVWFTVKLEFAQVEDNSDLGELFFAIGRGIKKGFANAKVKYEDLLKSFFDGAVAGLLASVTTTLCNVFFATGKNIVRIIRQSYVFIVQSAKTLFINPDNLLFGDRMNTVVKILATGASVVAGGLLGEAIRGTGIGAVPLVGGIVSTFCGVFVAGIMSCSFLYFFDRNKTMNKLVSVLNNLHTIETEVHYYREQAAYFEIYAAELMEIDLDKFRKESETYFSLSIALNNVAIEEELHELLVKALYELGIKMPWKGEFDGFMNNKSNVLVFE